MGRPLLTRLSAGLCVLTAAALIFTCFDSVSIGRVTEDREANGDVQRYLFQGAALESGSIVLGDWGWANEQIPTSFASPPPPAPPVTTATMWRVQRPRYAGEISPLSFGHHRMMASKMFVISGHDVSIIPLWPAFLLSAILPARYLVVLHRRRYAAQARRVICPTCGYDLRATPDRCPECGNVLK